MRKVKIGLRFLDVIFLTTLTTQVVVGDAWDPGDNLSAGATPLTNILETVQSHGPHTASLSDIADWFSIEMNAGSTYYLESTGPDDMIAYLYSDLAAEHEVIRNDDGGSEYNFKIVYIPSVSGTYYLKVKHAFNATSDYWLSYYKEVPPTDSWDPVDDTGAGATLLTINMEPGSHGPHVLNVSDTNDWFRFSLTAGESYQFETVVDDPSTQDTYGTLYSDAAGSDDVASDDDSGEDNNFRITYAPSVSGDYYLKVQELNGDPAGYSLEYRQVVMDHDGDGLGDAWEIMYFGNTNAQPLAHGDADIFNNLDEYIAGTDPTNSESFFAVTNISAGSLILQWASVSNREYMVYWSDSLTNGFQYLEPTIEHPQHSFTDATHAAENTGFYKVKVQLK